MKNHNLYAYDKLCFRKICCREHFKIFGLWAWTYRTNKWFQLSPHYLIYLWSNSLFLKIKIIVWAKINARYLFGITGRWLWLNKLINECYYVTKKYYSFRIYFKLLFIAVFHELITLLISQIKYSTYKNLIMYVTCNVC